VRRHPHIYANLEVKDEQEVKQNWEKLKLKEGNSSVLSGVPASLPALLKAYRIQEKVRGVGFDWEEPAQVWEKVKEEMGEFEQEFNTAEISPEQQAKAELEFGDLIFAW
jgi:XTP/dITP diphosphohydrolase